MASINVEAGYQGNVYDPEIVLYQSEDGNFAYIEEGNAAYISDGVSVESIETTGPQITPSLRLATDVRFGSEYDDIFQLSFNVGAAMAVTPEEARAFSISYLDLNLGVSAARTFGDRYQNSSRFNSYRVMLLEAQLSTGPSVNFIDDTLFGNENHISEIGWGAGANVFVGRDFTKKNDRHSYTGLSVGAGFTNFDTAQYYLSLSNRTDLGRRDKDTLRY